MCPADSETIDQPVAAASPAREPAPTAVAYVLDEDSTAVVARAFSDLGIVDTHIARGGISSATEELVGRGWPRFLVVDVSGIDDPMPYINHLAEICNPDTEVIVIGDRNDIVLYRGLKAAGVAEYFFKPLVESLLAQAIAGISSGTRAPPASRSGRLVYVLGVRGGVGVTTIATNLAWYLAETRERRVLLLDLDLQHGDAMLQLNAQPSHALKEAIDEPSRIDELFLERGVAHVTQRLDALGGLEPLSEKPIPSEEMVTQTIGKLLPHYRYVFVDLPRSLALDIPALLRQPSTLLLVSDGGITSARDVARWRQLIGPNTPERVCLHVLNKRGAAGDLPIADFQKLAPAPDISIRWDRKVMAAARLGATAVQRCDAIREGMTELSLNLSGGAVEAPRGMWKRIFARWD